jgi:phage portal protein BeeE
MKILSAVFAAVLLLGSAVATLSADPMTHAQRRHWDHKHPRRHQVLHRLHHQKARIEHKEADGKMTDAQGNAILRQDQSIHQEEKADAAENGGHITKAEQGSLNQQENQTSGEIHNQ